MLFILSIDLALNLKKVPFLVKQAYLIAMLIELVIITWGNVMIFYRN